MGNIGKSIINHIKEQDKIKLDKVIKTIENIDERCKTYFGKTKWNPISWYECHLCVPQNAQKDFVEGAIETAKLIISTNVPERTQEWIRLQRNKDYANHMLLLLEERVKI